jgi:hypothetical protein
MKDDFEKIGKIGTGAFDLVSGKRISDLEQVYAMYGAPGRIFERMRVSHPRFGDSFARMP